ncbi:MAG: PAS domain S-box protein [Deltaproteobacteria bacterium]|nr:PAS domain S-box protein [Deltaproteobacteria bacterium]MBW2104508.1 PAS domain S-box protein [Deltaproteobacteria bacterium]
MQNSNIVIVGGGKVCRAVLAIILGKNFINHKLSILGVADINDKAEGLVYAKERGIFTTTDYKDLFSIKGLNLIIELTGDNEVLEKLKKNKPAKVRLIDHLEAMSVWDFLQIEEERVRIKKDLKKYINEPERIKTEFDRFSEQLAKIVEERTRHLQTVEKELVERERALSQIIQGNTIPTFVINKDHIVTHWNIACEKLTGYKSDEIVGTNKQWLPFRAEERPIMADVIVDGMNEKEIKNYYGQKWSNSALIEGAYEAEEFFPNIGEKGKWLFFTAAPIKGSDGKTVGSIETLWDTTERKEAQEALQRAHDELEMRVEQRTAELKKVNEELRRSEEKYKTLFDSAPNPIFIMDRHSFSIIDVNTTAVDCYQQSREELLKKSFFDLLFEEDKELEEGLKKLTNNQCVFYPRRRHIRKGGEPFYVNIVACHAVHLGKENVIATTTDINETVEKEAQLVQASKLATLGTLASGMAHELTQPLNVIQVASDFFLKKIKKGEEISKDELSIMAEEIGSHVDRASKVIKHMREFARQSDLTRSELNINEPIKDVFKVMGQQLRVHQIGVELDLDPNVPHIMAEHNRLEQVFVNLVTNAMYAMDDKALRWRDKKWKKLLKIKSFPYDNKVVVTVSDTGKGIPTGIMDKIFEPFFTTREVGQGTGLGMSISYRIISDYGGTIEIESEVDKGTTFTLKFPAVE